MKQEKLKAIYLDVSNNAEPVITEIKDDLDTFYRLIKCSCIDIVSRKIGSEYFDIICDDEGLLIDNPTVSAINEYGHPELVGNLIIVGQPDNLGNLQSLTENQAKEILRNFCFCAVKKQDGLKYYHILRLN